MIVTLASVLDACNSLCVIRPIFKCQRQWNQNSLYRLYIPMQREFGTVSLCGKGLSAALRASDQRSHKP